MAGAHSGFNVSFLEHNCRPDWPYVDGNQKHFLAHRKKLSCDEQKYSYTSESTNNKMKRFVYKKGVKIVPRGNTEKPQFTPTVNCNPKLTKSKVNIDSLLRYFSC